MIRIAKLEARQIAAAFPDCVAPRAELVSLGIPGSTVTRRCRAGGPWRRLLPGIVLLRAGEPSSRQRLRAALLHAGPSAVITGVAAARRHGVRDLPADHRVHVLIPDSRRVTSREFVVVQRTRRLPAPVFHEDFPLAPVARSLADAAARLDDLDEVRAMIANAVQQRMCTPDDLVDELAERRRPYTALPRTVLVEILDGVRSVAEAWARSLALRSGLPPPEWNVALHEPGGQLIAVVDAYWRSVGMAWEIDSVGWHLSPNAHARGAERQSGLAAHGVLVVHSVPRRLRTRPATVLDELRRAYRQAQLRPPAPLIVRPWRPETPGQAAI